MPTLLQPKIPARAASSVPRLVREPKPWTLNGVTGIYLDRTPVGWGVFAGRMFAKNEPIFAFTGALLDLKSTLALGSWSFYSVQIGPDKYLDVEPPGAFINHSCSPNCGRVRCRQSGRH